MATEILKSIGTATRDYSTLQAWEDANGGATSADLVSNDETVKGEAYADSDFTSILQISGFTTDVTRRVHLTAAAGEEHIGTMAGGGVKIKVASGNYGIRVGDDYTLVEKFLLEDTGSAKFALNHQAFGNAIGVIYNRIISKGWQRGIESVNNPTGEFKIRNSVAYDYTSIGYYGDSATGVIENCTAHSASGASNGFYSVAAKNCIAMGTHTDKDFRSGVTGDYNLDSDNTAPGANSVHSKTDTDQFVSVGTDFHLKSGADAIGVGQDLSGSFTDDLDGDSRSVPWDIGADQKDAAASKIQIVQHQYRQRRV